MARTRTSLCAMEFALLLFSLLPFSVPVTGFSTRKPITPTNVDLRINTGKIRSRGISLSSLNNAIDPTFVDRVPPAAGDKEKSTGVSDRSYDFISVDEAEDALRRERARHEAERSKLQHLIDTQTKRIREYQNHSHGNHNEMCSPPRTGDGFDNLDRKPSARIVVHDFVTGVINNGKRIRNKRQKCNSRGSGNSSSNNRSSKRGGDEDDIISRMGEMEARLRDVLIDNEELTRHLRDQRHQFRLERADLEDQIREGQDRLDCVRDELHMERAYFETSRRMLERLLQDEQRKIQELEQEILMLITREHIFTDEQISVEQQQQQCKEYAQNKQQQEEEQQRLRRRGQQIQEEKSYAYNNYSRNRKEAMRDNSNGFTMNINDVVCPLFP